MMSGGAGPAKIDDFLEEEAAAYRAGDADKLTRIVDRRCASKAVPRCGTWLRCGRAKDRCTPSGTDSRASVVVTVRADFYNPLIRNPFPRGAPAEAAGQHPADEPGRLRSVMGTPAKTAGLSFAPPALVDRIQAQGDREKAIEAEDAAEKAAGRCE
jgi:hypothetical protein